MTFYITGAVEIIATVAGTAMSVYSQQQQAQYQAGMANYDYAVQKQQAELDARVAQQQSLWKQQADEAQAQAQQNNAITIENQALQAQAEGRNEASRLREANERQLATQRAHYASAGVTSEGSPLAVMAETAGMLELGVQDKAYQTDVQSRELYHKADEQRFESGTSLRDARLQQYQSAVAQSDLNLKLLDLNGNLSGSLSDNQFTANLNSAQAINSGIGSVASTVGSTVNSGAKYSANQAKAAQAKE